MKKLFVIMPLFCLLSLFPNRAKAQATTGSITTQGADCNSTNCVQATVSQDNGGVLFSITGNTGGSTLQFEGEDASGNWFSIAVTPSGGGTTVTSTTSNNVAYQGDPSGYTAVRVRCSTFVSGTAKVTISTSRAVALANGGKGGGTVSGTAPIAVSGAGAVSCTTCATTTNGGALSGTSPVTVSAAGAIGCATCTTGLGIFNSSQTSQTQVVVSGTEYYITHSDLDMPATYHTAIGAGTVLRWHIGMTKTAAGTGSFQILLKDGTNGSIADATDATITIGTQTAAVDDLEFDLEITFTSATAYYYALIPRQAAATATGFGLVYPATAAQFTGTASGLTTTTASNKYGLSFKATTGTPTIVVNEVAAEAFGVN